MTERVSQPSSPPRTTQPTPGRGAKIQSQGSVSSYPTLRDQYFFFGCGLAVWVSWFTQRKMQQAAVAKSSNCGPNNMLFLGNRFPGRNDACVLVMKTRSNPDSGAAECLNFVALHSVAVFCTRPTEFTSLLGPTLLNLPGHFPFTYLLPPLPKYLTHPAGDAKFVIFRQSSVPPRTSFWNSVSDNSTTRPRCSNN